MVSALWTRTWSPSTGSTLVLVKVMLGSDYIHHRRLQGRGGRITRAVGVDGSVGATQQAYKSRSLLRVLPAWVQIALLFTSKTEVVLHVRRRTSRRSSMSSRL